MSSTHSKLVSSGRSTKTKNQKDSKESKHDKVQNTNNIRNSQIIDTRAGGEDPILKERIKQVMEMTRRSEDDVVMALHDNDGDFDGAVNDLLEGVKTEWEVKKKKPRQPSGAKTADQSSQDNSEWEERRNQRSGGPPRMRGRANHDNRGWRGRENKENEKNMEDGVRDGYCRRGRGGPGRSGRGGRGGGRGLGPRTFANRNDPTSTHSFNRPIDTWTGEEQNQQNVPDSKMAWNNLDTEDWDNEEYTGSLADTKVFTPSTNILEPAVLEEQTQDVSSTQTGQEANLLLQQEELPKLSEMQQQQQQSLIQQTQQQQQQQQTVLSMPTLQSTTINSNVLTAAQSQYFSQLQQTSETLKGTGQTTFSSSISQAQRQTKQRPRVPPPSKIPSSAVEMPGDAVNNGIMQLIDVQFGALEFGSDTSSLDGSANEKFSSTTITGVDITSGSNAINTASATNSLDTETTQSSTVPYNTSSQMLSSTDNLPVSSEHTTSQNFSARGTTSQSLELTKQDFASQVSPGNAPTYGTTTSYQTQKTFQSSGTPSTYAAYSNNPSSTQSAYQNAVNSSNYSATVTQSNFTSTFPQNASFSQTSPSASTSTTYNQPTTTSQVYQSSGYVPVTTTQYQTPSVGANTVSNSNTAGYQTYNQQPYQSSVTTFTQSSGAYQSAAQSAYASTYGSYASQQPATSHHKINNSTKDSQYDSSVTTSNNSLATTTAPTLGLTSASVNSQTKVTNSNAVPKSTSSGVVTGSSGTSNMTGGSAAGSMTPMLGHQYIMGQAGVPYFQQPVYSYEDLQIVQQRIPHMPTTYYDAALPGYQTTGPATSLGSGRGDALSGVQGVQNVQGVQGAYTSISDARFARNDSNASPVPSTMPQQTATQHQQPLINPTLPPGYAYAFTYSGGIMPGSFQYGTPIYPQIATAGNAGTNSGAYSAKPGSYGSGYGAGASYDALASAGPSGEYKGAGSSYTGTQTGKTGTSGTANTNTAGSSATDISATIYAKNHVALGKVNSYEKQTFHSATPPPFGLTGSQNAGLPGGYGAPHLFIPTMPHQLHQPLHQEGGNSTGQRSNSSSQNKAQAKPGYSPSYWTGSN
ncbi:protein lingerer isoform X2 [Pseudomyrmex gracilis]|uniref:protein lingerer isoform X2 n=1 Tax=Pseudomyrmex gracilis TaxID=219809 RepID=UPI000994ED47|nr:protein lingerer isoform X2 [Pseudomyrmex gracilis]